MACNHSVSQVNDITGSRSHQSVSPMAKSALLFCDNSGLFDAGLTCRPKSDCVQSRRSAETSAASGDSQIPSSISDCCCTVNHHPTHTTRADCCKIPQHFWPKNFTQTSQDFFRLEVISKFVCIGWQSICSRTLSHIKCRYVLVYALSIHLKTKLYADINRSYNHRQENTYPKFFQFNEMTDVFNHFYSVWCNIKCCQVHLQYT